MRVHVLSCLVGPRLPLRQVYSSHRRGALKVQVPNDCIECFIKVDMNLPVVSAVHLVALGYDAQFRMTKIKSHVTSD